MILDLDGEMTSRFSAQMDDPFNSIVLVWADSDIFVGALAFEDPQSAGDFCNLVNRVVTLDDLLSSGKAKYVETGEESLE